FIRSCFPYFASREIPAASKCANRAEVLGLCLAKCEPPPMCGIDAFQASNQYQSAGFLDEVLTGILGVVAAALDDCMQIGALEHIGLQQQPIECGDLIH